MFLASFFKFSAPSSIQNSPTALEFFFAKEHRISVDDSSQHSYQMHYHIANIVIFNELQKHSELFGDFTPNFSVISLRTFRHYRGKSDKTAAHKSEKVTNTYG